METDKKTPEIEKLDHIRHSLAHLLAAAVLKEFPDAKFGIGPVIDNGFYYDFELPSAITPDNLKIFEKNMRKMISEKLPFSGKKVDVAEVKEMSFESAPSRDCLAFWASWKRLSASSLSFIGCAAATRATERGASCFSTRPKSDSSSSTL